MLDFDGFKAVTFDCYGTLIDWETGIAAVVAPWLPPGMPADLAISAFALMQAQHQQVRPTLPYPEVLRRSWRDIEKTFGWPVNADRAEAFAASVGDWPAFADTVPALRRLARRYRLAILSNVDNASLARTLNRLEVPFALTVTAEDVGSYKPCAPHFEQAIALLAAEGVARSEILHVAQSRHHDVRPGRAHGLATVWVDRRHGRPGSGATLPSDAEPDLAVTSLAELIDRMGEAVPA